MLGFWKGCLTKNGVVKVWDLEADKCREEIIPAADIAVRSVTMVIIFIVIFEFSDKFLLYYFLTKLSVGLVIFCSSLHS